MAIIKDYLIKIIKAKGPISIEEFMNIIMTRYEESYYANNLSIGSEGDFVTAPEISQLFGESIAFSLINMWQNLSKGQKIDLIELGPGKATLMQDIIRIIKKIPEFYQAINSIHFIESNKKFEDIQRKAFSSLDKNLFWYKNFEDINLKNPFFVIANEFFDALPIRQYIKRDKIWYEIMVNLSPKSELFFSYRQLLDKELVFDEIDFGIIEDGDIIEIHDISNKIFRNICDQVKDLKGGAIIIDYGYIRDYSNRKNNYYISSLQSVKSHKYNPILENIGEADISVMVDFTSLIKIAKLREFTNITYLTQRDFLTKYGIEENIVRLSKKATKEQINQMMKSYNRLTNPTEMGNIFKVLEISEY